MRLNSLHACVGYKSIKFRKMVPLQQCSVSVDVKRFRRDIHRPGLDFLFGVFDSRYRLAAVKDNLQRFRICKCRGGCFFRFRLHLCYFITLVNIKFTTYNPVRQLSDSRSLPKKVLSVCEIISALLHLRKIFGHYEQSKLHNQGRFEKSCNGGIYVRHRTGISIRKV